MKRKTIVLDFEEHGDSVLVLVQDVTPTLTSTMPFSTVGSTSLGGGTAPNFEEAVDLAADIVKELSR